MYNLTLGQFIANFLINAEDFLKKIDSSDANSYNKNAIYVISSLFIATEMLFREIGRKKISYVTPPKSKPKTSLTEYYRQRCSNDPLKFKKSILNNEIKINLLIDTFIECAPSISFGLNSINSLQKNQTIHQLRKIRNRLVHEGNLFLGDFGTVEESFKIISNLFKEIYDADHLVFYYKEQIHKLPNNIEPFGYVKRVYKEFLILLKDLLDKSKSSENWKVYCYSKFIVCILFSNAYEQIETSQMYDLTNLLRLFANFECRNVLFGDSFNKINADSIFIQLRDIRDDIFNLEKDSDKRFLNWSELTVIREIVFEYAKSHGLIIGAEYNKVADIPDIDLTELILKDSRYQQMKKLILKDESIIKKYELVEKLEKERMAYLEDVILDFRQKITKKMAKRMLDCSLSFCKNRLRQM